jgi:HD-GYP domain-containing protein (c-di-GMP phosphodiesterase class II)
MRVGELLRSGRRRIDLVARAGGEEFAVILPETGERDAFLVSERMRAAVEGAFADGPVPITMSFGLATFPGHGATADALLSSADQALYAAKELGRNRTVIFSDELSETGAQPGDRELHLDTLIALAEAIDLRDSRTADHSHTVGRYAGVIAAELGLGPGHVRRVEIAGKLHDIGKVGLPDSILRKPGPLTDEEWAQLRHHAQAGADILGSGYFEDIRGWILAHHERPDGAGYPLGLKGEEIPLESRILSVADAYEAMTADRAYRPALGVDQARAELRRSAGSQFDSRVVGAFLTALQREDRQAALAPAPGSSDPARQ